jgi:hypothetical protein
MTSNYINDENTFINKMMLLEDGSEISLLIDILFDCHEEKKKCLEESANALQQASKI